MRNEFEKHKYKSLSAVLNEVCSSYINVDADEMKKATDMVMSVFDTIESKMCSKDRLFGCMIQDTSIGGSVGDDLKVFCPDEYDVNVVLKLPKCFDVYPSNIPGYVHVKEIEGFGNINRLKYLPSYLKDTEDLYLLPKQLLRWTQSLLDMVLNYCSRDYFSSSYLINIRGGEAKIRGHFKIKPGFTLELEVPHEDFGEEEVSVDVVPCFEYDCSSLPMKYRKQISDDKCLLIPKEPERDVPFKERYWRLCFQDFERSILHHKQWLKPTIKLLKVLKENLDITAICSYHIKAICLYEVQKAKKNDEFWKYSLSDCFLRLLKACIAYIGSGNIPAVYDAKCNLIEHIKPSVYKAASVKLKSVLKKIVENADTRVVAQYLLHEDDFDEFLCDFHFSEEYHTLALRFANTDLNTYSYH